MFKTINKKEINLMMMSINLYKLKFIKKILILIKNNKLIKNNN